MTEPQTHNPEIWATRIQRELLALTTDNADAESTDEVRSMIPPFVRVKQHHLDIQAGTCTVDFELEIKTKSDETTAATAAVAVVTVVVDASLPKRPDGSFNSSASCYPFTAPTVRLLSGRHFFPPGSTIQDGDAMAMDLDWTPSLHLTDAIMNISLKVKESILQGEAFHAAKTPDNPVEEIHKGARRFAASMAKAFSSPQARLPRNNSNNTASNSNKKQPAAAASAAAKKSNKKEKSSFKNASDICIGDEINMLEEPWVEAHGVYSCKAIRRPAFVTKAIEESTEAEEKKSFNSPQAMFRSFTKSARSVLEESFLMITESHILELRANKLQMNHGTIVFLIPIDHMAKLKFRRQESLSLFFKAAPDEPLIYMCPDSGDAVHQIQSVLKRHGVKGKHTNAAAYRAINEAMQLVQEIQTKELALKHDPSVERVNDIMDLYRQAAERFETAGDLRHEEVVTHMRKFLALPLTTSILDGSYKKQQVNKSVTLSRSKGGVPEGEVLERTDALVNADEFDGPESKENEMASDKAFEENIDNLLTEAKQVFEKFKIEDNDTLDTEGTASADELEDAGLADVAADLDAMMREADKELAALMNA